MSRVQNLVRHFSQDANPEPLIKRQAEADAVKKPPTEANAGVMRPAEAAAVVKPRVKADADPILSEEAFVAAAWLQKYDKRVLSKCLSEHFDLFSMSDEEKEVSMFLLKQSASLLKEIKTLMRGIYMATNCDQSAEQEHSSGKGAKGGKGGRGGKGSNQGGNSGGNYGGNYGGSYDGNGGNSGDNYGGWGSKGGKGGKGGGKGDENERSTSPDYEGPDPKYCNR